MNDRCNNIVGSSLKCFDRADDAGSITNYIYTIKPLKKDIAVHHRNFIRYHSIHSYRNAYYMYIKQ